MAGLDFSKPADWALFCREMSPTALDAFGHLIKDRPKYRAYRTSWGEGSPWLFLFVKRSQIWVQFADGSAREYVPVLEDARADDWAYGRIAEKHDA